MYGWDIIPRAVSAGLWGSVRLELRRYPRIAALYVATLRASEASHLDVARVRDWARRATPSGRWWWPPCSGVTTSSTPAQI